MAKIRSISIYLDNGEAITFNSLIFKAINDCSINHTFNKVAFIKALRAKYGLGLLEAKILADICECAGPLAESIIYPLAEDLLEVNSWRNQA